MEERDQINGKTYLSHQEEPNQPTQNQDETFVWDEISQLYYHARTGFYHDPNAGWYYSTIDGHYYKFEDGNYILLDSHKGDQSEYQGKGESALWETAMCGQDYNQINDQNLGEADQNGFSNSITTELPENHPPPSEWLEDTLIELYLSGYPNAASHAADEHFYLEETDERDSSLLSADGSNVLHGQGDSECNLDRHAATDLSTSVVHEGASWDEENWRAQYGQVVQEEAEHSSGFSVIDIWDWSMVKEIQEEGNRQVARIVGRLVQPSCKLHPSMPSGGRRLRTAPICKSHLDLVQVRSGQVYKLRSPNAEYLATLSSYDASNPAKDWGFPDLSVKRASESCASKAALEALSQENTSLYAKNNAGNEKKNTTYRDRAAERRAFHGGFGVAPGQKRSVDDASPDLSPVSDSVEEAAAEALEMSFGAGSYAQKILKNMGWNEGEALGKTQQGLKEPLQSVGNKGTAGLGWQPRPRK